MWLSILDYRTAEVIVKEVDDEVENADDYVRDLIGHQDHYYMSAESLVIKIDEKNSENIQIITKLKQWMLTNILNLYAKRNL